MNPTVERFLNQLRRDDRLNAQDMKNMSRMYDSEKKAHMQKAARMYREERNLEVDV